MKHRLTADDGFNPELVTGATFEGIFEIPHINPPRDVMTLKGFTPFSKRRYAPTDSEALCFFEMDTIFADVLRNPYDYIDEFKSFPVFVPCDNSLYRDSPLAVQIANIYRSRAIGHFYQYHGLNVYPLVRWGDERTYTKCFLPEKVAFTGIEHNSPVVISTYGCIRGKENKYHFQAGLEAMLEELEPSLVIVYGSMPDKVFAGFANKSVFHHFPDWITRVKGDKRIG
jgi:hypothetical protein